MGWDGMMMIMMDDDDDYRVMGWDVDDRMMG